jgi:very-short-patch-repair endonuclease
MPYTQKNRRLKGRLRAKALQALEAKKTVLFPSPVETRMIEVLGGKCLTIDSVRDKETGRKMVIVWKQPKLLKKEHFRRTGDKLVIYSNDLKMGLAIQGREYERDVLAAQERDEMLSEHGWRVRYIKASWLWNDEPKVRAAVTQFIYS